MNPNNSQKVSLILIIFKFIFQGPTNPRYKTTLCKHFNSPQGCSYGDKCQFAHGNIELRLNNNQGFPQMGMADAGKKMQNSMLNYKIVKCKNWEKDGTCKYGAHCTFAHGDKELRNKSQNLYQMNSPMMMIPMMNEMYPIPMMMPAPGMDMNQMPQMMAPQNINQNQFMMMMPPIQDGMNNNNDNNNNNAEPKGEINQQ